MSDLIDRQAAIATAISGRVRTLPTTEDGENWIRVNEVRDSLLSLPTAQPKRGKWIVAETVYEDVVAKCSVCGFETLVNEPGNGLHCVDDLHFCPNCGADMRGNRD